MKIGFISCLLFLVLIPALWSQNAPVTMAGCVTDAVPGDPSVPVTVSATDFVDIGQFTLTMKFDTTRILYISAATNPLLPGMTVTYTPPVGDSKGKIVLEWTGATNISLSDGVSLADLTFHYVTGTGLLSWAYTFGAICRYKRYSGSTLVTLTDNPKYQYYQNGGVSNRTAPVTIAPIMANPSPGALPVPVTVNAFSGIRSITLYLEYDPGIITYQNSFTKNPAFDSNFIVGDNPGGEGKRLIVIQWFGFTPIDLADGSTLCTLDFNYPTPTCNPCLLAWSDSGPSCEYVDGLDDVLIDMPQSDYYIDGVVAPGLPVTWTGNVSNVWNDAGNWSECGTPDSLRNVMVADVSPNPFPVINTSVCCRSIEIQPNAILTISSSGSLIIED